MSKYTENYLWFTRVTIHTVCVMKITTVANILQFYSLLSFIKLAPELPMYCEQQSYIKRSMAAVSLQWSTNHRLASLTALMSCNNGSTGGHSRSAAELSLYYWLIARLYRVIGNEHGTNFKYSLKFLTLTLHISENFKTV